MDTPGVDSEIENVTAQQTVAPVGAARRRQTGAFGIGKERNLITSIYNYLEADTSVPRGRVRMLIGKPARGLVWLFISTTIGSLVVIAALIATQPGFPLDIGLVRTTGRTGLFLTLVPAMVGLAGLLQTRRRRPAGAWLVAAYSAFWGLVFLGGLPQVWNVERSFCLERLHFCIVSPWVARLTVLGLATPFLLSAWWSVRQARRGVASEGIPVDRSRRDRLDGPRPAAQDLRSTRMD